MKTNLKKTTTKKVGFYKQRGLGINKIKTDSHYFSPIRHNAEAVRT